MQTGFESTKPKKNILLVLVSTVILRKGIAVHHSILEGYMDGMDIKAEDRLIVCDLVPNRTDDCETWFLLVSLSCKFSMTHVKVRDQFAMGCHCLQCQAM